MFSLVSLGHKTRGSLLLFFLVAFLAVFIPLTTRGQTRIPTATKTPTEATTTLGSLKLPSLEEFKNLPREEQIKLLDDIKNKTTGKQNENEGGCSDYYQFQSVVFSLKSDETAYQPGDTVRFEGTVENKNTYPIFDGFIFVRIARDSAQPYVLGNDIVAEEVLVQKVVLPASGKINQPLSYTLPANLTGGKYSASFFFSVGGRFNLAGLPFTNEVVGTNIRFTVDGPQGVAIRFDRTATKINEKTYAHIGNWPVIDEGKKAIISNTLVNESNLSQTVTVQYDWYRWDGLRESDRLAQSSEIFTLKPKEKKVITYQTVLLTEPVYYLRTTAISGVTKSIINVRLATNASRLRLNYVGVNIFPISKDQEGTVFACFHNTSSALTQGSVNVKAYSDGKLLAEVATSTKISGAIEVITKKIIGPLSNLDIKAEISDEKGIIIDRYEYKYQCQDIPGNTSCLQSPQKTNSSFMAEIVGSVVILGVMLLGLFVIKRKKNV